MHKHHYSLGMPVYMMALHPEPIFSQFSLSFPPSYVVETEKSSRGKLRDFWLDCGSEEQSNQHVALSRVVVRLGGHT